jgi:HEAT repeat protein
MAGENTEGLERNLIDLGTYFLEVGDFQALTNLHDQLSGCEQPPPDIPYSPLKKALAAFETSEFMDGVLKGVHYWGKEKYPHIEKLAKQIGKALIEPALGYLAEEASLSIRRFYIDLLIKMGEGVRNAALSRLRDKRWYFVRNLILILRHLDDPSILPAIKKLLGHRHPRVREEVFRTLSYFQDPDAEQMLLEDLSSQEREVQRSAIQLAEDSRGPEVFHKLLDLLNRGGIFGADFDLKIEIIRTLAKIRNPESLAHLERLLRSRNFLHRQAMNRLKEEAIGSLEFYPAKEAIPFLEGFSGDRELANGVSQTLKKIMARAGS